MQDLKHEQQGPRDCQLEIGAARTLKPQLPDLNNFSFAVDDEVTFRSVSFAVPVEANTLSHYRGGSRSVKQQQYNAPPKLPGFFCLARTTFHTQLSSAVVWPRLLRLARTNGVEAEDLGDYELRCSAFVHHSVLDFNCRLFQDGAGLLVEFRRSRGCGCAFAHLFRAFSKAIQSPSDADDVAGALLSRVEAAMSPPALPPLLLLPLPAPLAGNNDAAGSEALTILAEVLNGGMEDSVRECSVAAADLAAAGVDVLCSDAMATALEALLSSRDSAARAAAASAVASVAEAAAAAAAAASSSGVSQRQKHMSAACQQRVVRLRRCLRQLLAVCGDQSCCHARREAAKALLYLSRTAVIGGEVRALGGAEALRSAARCGAQDALLSRYASEALRNIQGAC